ncbi:MAG: ankyrin repeat domain-containing protein [Helicobacteraceae bacterium]|jgi:ankyrin repeat protein|nr:ankyrin repeat domain-containing protein [Helicobacteraceae bacterium]
MKPYAALAALGFLLLACVQPHTGLVKPSGAERSAAKPAESNSLTQTLAEYYAVARSTDPSLEAIEDLSRTLTRLIEGKQANPNAAEQGFTPLSIAAQANDRAMIERLCKVGANYDAAGAHRIPLLVLSLQEGALESAKGLLACGANPNIGGAEFPTPLTIATLGGITSVDYRQMAIALLDAGANPNLGAVGGHPLLLYAIKTAQGDLARKIVEKGANIELADDEGMTALSWAILLKDDETVQALLAKGAASGAIDAHGYTPLSWAVFTDNQSAIASLASVAKLAQSERGALAAQAAKSRTLSELRALVAGEAIGAKTPVSKEGAALPSIARFKGMEFLSLEYGGDKIAFKTADPLLKDFALENPARLVLDFSRANAVQSLSLPLDPNGTFRRASIGRHTGSYRVVIALDKSYRYDLERTAEGPVITLRR